MKKGIVVLPKSVTPSRIASNIKGAIAAAEVLTEANITQLDEVAPGGKQKRYVLPNSASKLIHWLDRLIRPPWGVPLGFSDWN